VEHTVDEPAREIDAEDVEPARRDREVVRLRESEEAQRKLRGAR
jgi:hypothetical protein